MPEPAVIVEGVFKTFQQGNKSIVALRDVHLVVHLSELMMIVGPSGCGKTTLISTIAGTQHFDQGSITTLGYHLGDLSEEELTAFRLRHVGFIFQQFHLVKTLNCAENVSIPLLLQGMKRKEAEERACHMLAEMGLKGREWEKPLNLSGGQQQRVAIARALVHQPPLIICDEPTSALDAETGAHIMTLLSNLAKSSERAVIVVTHDARIFHFADRVARMDDGNITNIGKNHDPTT